MAGRARHVAADVNESDNLTALFHFTWENCFLSKSEKIDKNDKKWVSKLKITSLKNGHFSF